EETMTLNLRDLTAQNNPLYNIVSYVWTVVVGQDSVVANGANPQITVPRGDFSITLDATASNNCSATISKEFAFNDFFPEVDFTFSFDGCDGLNGALLTFTENVEDTVTNAFVTSFMWQIGDQTFSGPQIQTSIFSDSIDAT